MMRQTEFCAPYWLTDTQDEQNFTLLLLAQAGLQQLIETVNSHLSKMNCVGNFSLLKGGASTQLYLNSKQAWQVWQELHNQHLACDFFIYPVRKPAIKLLVCDMDSTIIRGESLDDLAEIVGVGPLVAAITKKTMNGEMDFYQAINHRVALLSGVSVDIFNKLREQIVYSPGAEMLINLAKAQGIKCILVSGGFEQIVSYVASQLGFDDYRCNRLQISQGKLTGQIQQPVIDGTAKCNLLLEHCRHMSIDIKQVCALGDGANDLPMLQAAGLGVGYCAKSVVRAAIPNQINYGELDSLVLLL